MSRGSSDWLVRHLVCPRDKKALEPSGNDLVCPDGHRYPVFEGVPVMLLDDIEATHDYINQTLKKVAGTSVVPARPAIADADAVDAFVQGEVPYTSGNLYFPVQHKLTRYPIPALRLPHGHGDRLLDIGCNWGRWCVAAARKGYRPVGLDPSLDAVLAARRVVTQLGLEAEFVVGDARHLPFADDAFDTAFSYSVFQHFSKANARMSLTEVARVVRPGGRTLIQMPNKYAIRQYQQRRRRGFSDGHGFEVRHWTPSELLETFNQTFGRTSMTADCYFGLGIQASDADLLPFRYRVVVTSSELLRKVSRVVRPLVKVADSLYLESVNQKAAAR